jgi:hypothetical protein
MTYAKPELAVLGEAIRVMEYITNPKTPQLVFESVARGPQPAYDLDE